VKQDGGSPAGSPTGPLTPPPAPGRRGRVGVVAALPDEARCLTSVRVRAAAPFVVNADVLLCVSGIGAAAARSASEALLAAGAEALVSWGVAAGLNAAAAPGTLVLADRVAGLASKQLEPKEFESTKSWADRLAESLPPTIRVLRGPIGATDRVLSTRGDKLLAGSTGAVAADMETAAVAQVADDAGVPWIAIRAVSDATDAGLPESVARAIDEAGRVRLGRLAAGLLRRPGDLKQLPRLASGFAAALRTLRAVWAAAGPNFLAPRALDAASRVVHSAGMPVVGIGP
jgi:adenosylhomocysteine nucleosidase